MYMWYAAHTYTTGISGVTGCAGASILIFSIVTSPTIQTRVSRAVICVCLTGGSVIAIRTQAVKPIYLIFTCPSVLTCWCTAVIFICNHIWQVGRKRSHGKSMCTVGLVIDVSWPCTNLHTHNDFPNDRLLDCDDFLCQDLSWQCTCSEVKFQYWASLNQNLEGF